MLLTDQTEIDLISRYRDNKSLNQTEITIDTCQGVGDCAWVYSKLAPYFDKINLNILCIDHSELQTRAKKFIELLPKIGTINYKVTTSEHYNRVAWSHHKLQPILDNPNKIHEYAVNKPLEEGTRIDAIDPGTVVEWDLKFNVPETKFHAGNYIVLYISGSKNNMSWDHNKWASFIVTMYRRYKLRDTLVLFGASYDAAVLRAIVPILARDKMSIKLQIDGTPQDAIRCIRDARLFIGYQSGMNIIADNYNVPQIMLYFPYLKPMLNTWCKPGHAERKIFNGFTFDQTPEEILTSCQTVLTSLVNGNKL